METRDYRHFLHLAETLHFGRSAAELHISPSALTRAVQRIEAELGQALLVRDQRVVQLTPAGVRFRRFASEHLAQLGTLFEDFSLEQHSPSGDLNIACTVTACYSVLPRLIARCRAEFPRLALKLVTQDATRSMRQLDLGEVDLAVVPLPDRLSEELQATKLGETELVFIAPRGGAEWLDLLSRRNIPWPQIPLVAPLGGLERERLDGWLHSRKLSPHVYAEVRGNEGIIAMVSMGCGIGLVPELVLERSPLVNEVTRLTSLRPPRGYHVGLCVRQASLRRRAVEAFWGLATT